MTKSGWTAGNTVPMSGLVMNLPSSRPFGNRSPALALPERAHEATTSLDVLDGYDAFLRSEEIPWSTQSERVATAGRFLQWLAFQDGLRERTESSWDLREQFLNADCADREGRHDLRAHLQSFLAFLRSAA